jgi:Leucine-rich repeat (LRR) protein
LQFNLRTVLIVVTLVGLVVGLYMRPILKQRAYQAKWVELGARPNEDASCDEEVSVLNFVGQLGELPPEIGGLTNLRHLDVNEMQLTELPPEIGKLTKLNGLYVGRNQLTELPAEIGNLTSLTELYLRDNQLTELPPEIGKLTKLNGLYVGRNQLTELPVEIGNLTKLKGLWLLGNSITDADLEHLNPLENLTMLDLSATKVTKEGVTALQKALPNCEIESDF